MSAMNSTALERISCPYCGESFDVVIDPSEPVQEYIEDCYVCCRPMILWVSVEDGDEYSGGYSGENSRAGQRISVVARAENE